MRLAQLAASAAVVLSAAAPADAVDRYVAVKEVAGLSSADRALVAKLSGTIRAAAIEELRGRYQVMMPDNIEQILRKSGKKGQEILAQCSEASCAAQFGQVLGADLVLAGMLVEIDGTLDLTIEVYDVATANVLGSRSVRARARLELVDLVADATAAVLRRAVPAAARASRGEAPAATAPEADLPAPPPPPPAPAPAPAPAAPARTPPQRTRPERAAGVPIPGGTASVAPLLPNAPVTLERLAPFDLDATEVTVAAYARCVEAGACSPAAKTVEWEGMSDTDRSHWSRFCNGNRPDRADHPVNCVDYWQAEAYCAWLGRRLPSDPELQWAGRGGRRRRCIPGETTRHSTSSAGAA